LGGIATNPEREFSPLKKGVRIPGKHKKKEKKANQRKSHKPIQQT
jgi:hypothetical protein